MKIILQKSVENLGDPGDVVTVKDGYARNYLFPRQLAVLATRGGERHVESLKRAHGGRIAKMKGAAEEVAGKVAGQKVTLVAKAGEDGKLFGSVGAAEIAAAVSGQAGSEVDKRSVQLEEPIKHLGEHSVMIQLHPEVQVEVTVEVVGE